MLYRTTADGCEFLHQLKTVVNIPLFCWAFNHPKLVVQDFATINSSSWVSNPTYRLWHHRLVRIGPALDLERLPWGREPNPGENVWQTLWFASPTRRVGSKYPLVCLATKGTKTRKLSLCLWTCGLSKIHENVSKCWYLRIEVMCNDQKLFLDMEHIKKPMGCFSHQQIRNYS